MSILIITESNKLVSRIAKSIKTAETVYVLSNAFNILKFKYPNTCHWHTYPQIQNIKFQLLDWTELLVHEVTSDGEIKRCQITPEVLSNEHITLINMCDPDNRGSFIFETFLNHYTSELSIASIHYNYKKSPIANHLDTSIYHYIFDQLKSDDTAYQQQVKQAKVKYYFDYNWNINSFAVLGKTLKKAKVKTPINFSKNSLQLFLWISRHTKLEWKASELVQQMQDWKSTGKYSQQPRQSLGSPSSYIPIIDSLKNMGVLLTSPIENKYSLSELGSNLNMYIHKDCRDQDLPWRIKEWQQLSFGEAQQVIDRYIKTFFGKQKNFIDANY